jgi:hypothetical protein
MDFMDPPSIQSKPPVLPWLVRSLAFAVLLVIFFSIGAWFGIPLERPRTPPQPSEPPPPPGIPSQPNPTVAPPPPENAPPPPPPPPDGGRY